MMCTFERFDGSLLAHNASIAYKYVIHSPKSASDSNPYEFLHEHGHVNRCLIFPNNEVEKGINYYRKLCCQSFNALFFYR